MTQPLHILAVTRKPDSASYEQRVHNWIQPLADHDIRVQERVWPSSRQGQRSLLAEMAKADAVWWHRHITAAPTARRVRAAARRWVIDYDDPLNYSSRGGGTPSWTRRRRFAATVGRVDAVLTASAFLADLAKPYCHRVEVTPMAVDLPDRVPDRAADAGHPVTLLWLGSKSTQPYLQEIASVFGALPPGVTLRIVGGEPMDVPGIAVDHRPWSPREQDLALREADVGLCPMPDTVWTRGKCPYKTLQYMAWGLPWVGSAVGENVVAAGQDPSLRGLAVSSPAEWSQAISQLASDVSLRRRMGTLGRSYLENVHDRGVLTQQLVRFWRSVTGL